MINYTFKAKNGESFSTTAPKFNILQLVQTPGVLDSIPDTEYLPAMVRHMHGDWGEVSDFDKSENDEALKSGSRLVSAYTSTNGIKFLIISEAGFSVTTILLSDEY